MGWLTFLAPALLLLAIRLPGRVRQVTQMTTAERLFRDAPEHILAARAAFSLPFSTLTRYTHDPFGDLAEGRHRALLAALAEGIRGAGQRAPIRSRRMVAVRA